MWAVTGAFGARLLCLGFRYQEGPVNLPQGFERFRSLAQDCYWNIFKQTLSKITKYMAKYLAQKNILCRERKI